MKNKTSCQKTALFCILIIILLFLGSILWIFFHKSSSAPMVAEIYQDGLLLQRIRLDEVSAPYRFTVSGETHGENIIEVRPGEIAVVAADCPDKICVNQGFIHSDLLPITCLPNRLVIKLCSSSDQSDAITYTSYR